MSNELLRQLPSVDRLVLTDKAKALINSYGRKQVVDTTRIVLNDLRSVITNQEKTVSNFELSTENILEWVEGLLQKKFSYSLTKAINAAGIILHTGLGRAALPEAAQKNIAEVIDNYCSLAIDMETGRRGDRNIHLNSLLCELTGAQAATVVNNNAAATVLILNTLSKGKEIIISRGQLVEIGGSFRMPEIMAASGAIMREVGTTNKTHLKDYKEAINENTGALIRVHHSNYRIQGFSEEPSIEELAELATVNNLILIDDLGSGALVNLQEYGLENEPRIQDSIKAGVDVACFSGDKLIGGPQSGIIVGKMAVVKKIKKNPLARALRVDKMTIAGLEATLKLFLNPEKLNDSHPVYRMFSQTPKQLDRRAQRLKKKLRPQLVTTAKIDVVNGESQVGSGSVPTETLSTKLLRVEPLFESVDNLGKNLRSYVPPIFTRIQRDAVLFDFRTIDKKEDTIIEEALQTLLQEQ